MFAFGYGAAAPVSAGTLINLVDLIQGL